MLANRSVHQVILSFLLAYTAAVVGLAQSATSDDPPLLESMDSHVSPKAFVKRAEAYLERPGDNV